MGIVGFVLSLTLLLLGIPLLIVYPIGLLVLFSWLWVVRGLGAFERARIGVMLKSDIPFPPRRRVGGSRHRRFWSSMSDPVTWREFAYRQLLLPLGIFTFTFALLVWSIPLSLLATPFLMAGLGADLTAPEFLMLAVAAPLVGLAALAWLPWMIGALAHLDSAVAHAMLGPTERDRLGRRVTELASSRSRMVDASEQERRRIERDLHDGAGQQLVSLAMTLGMAKEKFATDPEAARALVDEGHQEAKQALATLRNIVRGISPAILSDLGPGAALSSVAARSTIPVALEVNVPHRLDPWGRGHCLLPGMRGTRQCRPSLRGNRSFCSNGCPRRCSRDRGQRRRARGRRSGAGHRPRRPRETELLRSTGDSRSRAPRGGPTGARLPRFPAAPKGNEVRIAIAEDSVLLRAGLVRLLSDAGEEVVAEAGDGVDLIEAVAEGTTRLGNCRRPDAPDLP